MAPSIPTVSDSDSCDTVPQQDHGIGTNTTIFDLKLNGSYPPYEDGIDEDIFIYDHTGKILEGIVSTEIEIRETRPIRLLIGSFGLLWVCYVTFWKSIY